MDERDGGVKKTNSLERIRQAVDKLSKEVGFERMTVRGICKEAEVSNGVFYHYFKSKNSLLFDRYIRTREYFGKLYEEKLQYMPPIEALQLYVQESAAYTKSRVREVLVSYLQVQLTDFEVWKNTYTGRADSWDGGDMVYTLFKKAREEGTIETAYTLQQLSSILQCMLMGIHYSYAATNGKALEDDTLVQHINSWLEGLKKS